MKRVLLSSVLLGSLLVGCSNSVENNQFSVVCGHTDGCYFNYIKHGEEVYYSLAYNEKLYFNYPDEGRIKLSSYYQLTKIYSTEEITTNNTEDVIISENNITLQH